MGYGLIEITDWIFYFSDETKNRVQKKKKKKMDEKRQLNFLSLPDFCQSVGRDQTNIFLFLAQKKCLID